MPNTYIAWPINMEHPCKKSLQSVKAFGLNREIDRQTDTQTKYETLASLGIYYIHI